MADAAPPTGELPPGFHDDRSWVSLFVVVLCLTVSTVMVSLRIYTRKVIRNEMGIDDYTAIITLIVTWGDGITIAVATKFGLGRHIFAVDPVDVTEYLKCFWVTIVLYTGGLLAAKLTFLFQYYRVLAVQYMRKVYIIAIIIVGAWGLSQFLIGILMCRPISGFWDKTVEASCIPNQPQFYINAAGNIATDVAVFLLPFPVIKHLNLPRSQKFILFGIFTIGFFTVAISVVRLKFIGVQADPTWDNVEASGWSIGELCSALTCACIPTLKPLLSRFFPALAVSRPRTNIGYTNRENGDAKDVESGVGAQRSVPRSVQCGKNTDLLDEKRQVYEIRVSEMRSVGTDDEAGK